MASFADDMEWAAQRRARLNAGKNKAAAHWGRGGTRADDRRTVGNSEGRRAAFDGGYQAQSEAKLTGSDDVGQGKGRAREAAWGHNKGAGGWTPY